MSRIVRLGAEVSRRCMYQKLQGFLAMSTQLRAMSFFWTFLRSWYEDFALGVPRSTLWASPWRSLAALVLETHIAQSWWK
jgi:hypothetical protein